MNTTLTTPRIEADNQSFGPTGRDRAARVILGLCAAGAIVATAATAFEVADADGPLQVAETWRLAGLPLRWKNELGEISSALGRMAEQLRRQLAETTRDKERLAAVLDSMVEGVLVVDERGRILLANARLREFYDVWDEVIGMTPLEAIRDAELDELVARAGESDVAVYRELIVARGTDRTLRVHALRRAVPGAHLTAALPRSLARPLGAPAAVPFHRAPWPRPTP